LSFATFEILAKDGAVANPLPHSCSHGGYVWDLEYRSLFFILRIYLTLMEGIKKGHPFPVILWVLLVWIFFVFPLG
jgi:hypothetical protein